ncbi:MAG: NAD(P)H-dependent oxidoreductase [Spirochaetales bacterium]|nr:NAD(P)H-dependent oxidoreductase [Spirochaetales bacterium]
MKILVISGSPRKKGNTMSMVKIVEKEMMEIDESIEFEYIHLIDKDLRFCRGCSLCLREGGDKCPLKDDGQHILKSMHNADGIIFASPGYSAMVSGLMKNFIDRFMYLDHIPELIAKPILIISTSGGDGVMGAPNYMAKMSFYWWACNIIDIIGIGHAFYTINDKVKRRTEKKLRKAAEKLYDTARLKPEPRPRFIQYMYFGFNRTELEISSSVMPYRTRVWKENNWLKMNYYYSTGVNPLFKLIGGIVFSAMKISYRILLGKDGDKKIAAYVREN